MIASVVSKRREAKDAENIIRKGKKVIEGGMPLSYIITDSLRSYEKAIRKEFQNRVAHIKTKAIKDDFTNRPIERYHNEIRENLKARRGLGNDKSSQKFIDMQNIHHNFVKPHEGLDGKTPAEVSGIDTDLGENKIAGLIRNATEKDHIPLFIQNLGKRIQYVDVINEIDSIRIVPKVWIRKDVWRQINDILHLRGFVWLSSDKDSCWLKNAPSIEKLD